MKDGRRCVLIFGSEVSKDNHHASLQLLNCYYCPGSFSKHWLAAAFPQFVLGRGPLGWKQEGCDCIDCTSLQLEDSNTTRL